MVMDGFMHLRDGRVLTRRVFDDIGLQTALNEGRLARRWTRARSTACSTLGLVPDHARPPSVDWLMRFGSCPRARDRDGSVRFTDGDAARRGSARHALPARARRRAWRDGACAGGQFLHGGFYLGSTVLLRLAARAAAARTATASA
jgi:hypothetical protein